ncbi:hypothetical protein DB32_005698 [Sandaracinus amylolyticus]|uniref:Uncharacterized protein n=2 Tax=Sandaracinus amylolyticus TaxID=927083 RepID=A0A0F6SGE4_9BACT|nr:hypothetical protein DB32_005698 [Sandaracinus amylolyticus]
MNARMTLPAGSCGACGVAIDVATAELDDQGRPVCRGCVDRADLRAGQARSTAAISGAASSAALLAFVSCFAGLYTAVPAVFVGAGALVAARTSDRMTPGSVATWVYVAAGFGLIVGLLRVLGLVAMMLAIAS